MEKPIELLGHQGLIYYNIIRKDRCECGRKTERNIKSVYDDSKSKYIEQLIISSEDTDNDSVTFND